GQDLIELLLVGLDRFLIAQDLLLVGEDLLLVRDDVVASGHDGVSSSSSLWDLTRTPTTRVAPGLQFLGSSHQCPTPNGYGSRRRPPASVTRSKNAASVT